MTEALKAKRKEDNTGVRATESSPAPVAATLPAAARVYPLLAVFFVCHMHLRPDVRLRCLPSRSGGWRRDVAPLEREAVGKVFRGGPGRTARHLFWPGRQ